METGVERIVDQVVNPKINTVFLSQVEDVVYKSLGIEKPSRSENKSLDTPLKISIIENLLPTDLEAISPDSDIHDDELNVTDENVTEKVINGSNENTREELNDSKMDEDESPPFEPLEESVTLMPLEENSVDSHLSTFSGIASHDSNQSREQKVPQVDISNQDSQISKHSSDEQMSMSISDDNETKMEVSEDSRYSKSSKSRDSTSKFEFNQDSQSNSDKSVPVDKKRDENREHKNSSKHKSSKSERRSSKDRDKDKKSESKDKKDKHSSSKDSKNSKDKRDSKSSKSHDKDKSKNKSSSGRHSSSSRDKSSSSSSKKESHSKSKSSDKEALKSNAKDHSKDSKLKDKGETKSTHSSRKHSSEKDKKDDKRKHSSSSHHKDKKDSKKDSKKETKDDHFSSKQGRRDRRSTDRDSNDGHSGQNGASNVALDLTSSTQSQKQSQESSSSNSGSADSCNSETDAVENTSLAMDFQRIKIIKPKFASNIHEAKRLMKIRKELDKIEKSNQLSLDLATNNSLLLISKPKGNENGLLDTVIDSSGKEENFQSSKVGSPSLENSVVMKETLDAIEEKFSKRAMKHSNEDYGEDNVDSGCNNLKRSDKKSKKKKGVKCENAENNVDTQNLIEAENQLECDDCLYFDTSLLPESQRYLKYAKSEMERLEQSIESMSSTKKLNNTVSPLMETSPRKNMKRKRNSDVANNNKNILIHIDNKEEGSVANNIHCDMVKRTRKSTQIVTVLNDNFPLPLSPADSEKSVDRKVEVNGRTKRNNVQTKG